MHAARAARVLPGTAVSTAPVDAMCRAHRQIMQQARLEQKFSTKPKAWLDWPAILTARARAVRAYEPRKEGVKLCVVFSLKMMYKRTFSHGPMQSSARDAFPPRELSL